MVLEKRMTPAVALGNSGGEGLLRGATEQGERALEGLLQRRRRAGLGAWEGGGRVRRARSGGRAEAGRMRRANAQWRPERRSGSGSGGQGPGGTLVEAAAHKRAHEQWQK